MARKEIGTKWDRVNRNNMNDNFKELYDATRNFVEEISEEVVDKVIDGSKLVWKEPVDSQSDLPSSASEGDTRMARDTGKVYRFDGSEWKEIQQIDSSPINEVDDRLSSQLEQIMQIRDNLGTTTITRTEEMLVSQIETPTTITTFNRDDNGNTLSTVEQFEDKTISTSINRDDDGNIQSIDRELI